MSISIGIPKARKKLVELDQIKRQLVLKKTLNTNKTRNLLYGRVGMLFDKRNNQQVPLNTIREVINVAELDDQLLVSTEHGGLFSVKNNEAMLIDFPVKKRASSLLIELR